MQLFIKSISTSGISQLKLTSYFGEKSLTVGNSLARRLTLKLSEDIETYHKLLGKRKTMNGWSTNPLVSVFLALRKISPCITYFFLCRIQNKITPRISTIQHTTSIHNK